MTKEGNKNNYSVYVHTTPSGKMYVGMTCQDVKKRWAYGNGYRTQVFYKAIQKYGWNNIQHEVIAEHLTKEEAENFEEVLIEKLKTRNRKYGYNVAKGGYNGGVCGEDHPNYGKHLSEETRKKISESNKGKLAGEKHPNYGKHMSKEAIDKRRKTKLLNPKIYTEEERKARSEIAKELWERPEYRERMSGKNAARYGRTGEKQPLYGKRGRDCVASKKVVCLNTMDTYDSAIEASKKTGCNHSKICMCCRGERKSCGKGKNGNKLHWMYYDDYKNVVELFYGFK